MFSQAWKHAQKVLKVLKGPNYVNDIEFASPWHASKLPEALRGSPPHNGSDEPPDSLYDALGVLRSFAIITIHLETKDISMHPLAHVWARDRLNEDAKQGALASTMSLVALSIGSSDQYEDFHRPLELHVESCINASPEETFNIYPAIEIGRVFYEFAWLFYRVCNYHRGKILTGILLQKKFGAEKFCLMNDSSIRYLHAICLHSLAEFRLAQTIFESIVYSDEGCTAATRGRKLSAMAALASIYRGEGKSDLALFILRGPLRLETKRLRVAASGVLSQHGNCLNGIAINIKAI